MAAPLAAVTLVRAARVAILAMAAVHVVVLLMALAVLGAPGDKPLCFIAAVAFVKSMALAAAVAVLDIWGKALAVQAGLLVAPEVGEEVLWLDTEVQLEETLFVVIRIIVQIMLVQQVCLVVVAAAVDGGITFLAAILFLVKDAMAAEA